MVNITKHDKEIFSIDGNGVRSSIWTDAGMIEILIAYGMIFAESGDDKYMPEEGRSLDFVKGVMWSQDH